MGWIGAHGELQTSVDVTPADTELAYVSLEKVKFHAKVMLRGWPESHIKLFHSLDSLGPSASPSDSTQRSYHKFNGSKRDNRTKVIWVVGVVLLDSFGGKVYRPPPHNFCKSCAKVQQVLTVKGYIGRSAIKRPLSKVCNGDLRTQRVLANGLPMVIEVVESQVSVYFLIRSCHGQPV